MNSKVNSQSTNKGMKDSDESKAKKEANKVDVSKQARVELKDAKNEAKETSKVASEVVSDSEDVSNIASNTGAEESEESVYATEEEIRYLMSEENPNRWVHDFIDAMKFLLEPDEDDSNDEE